MILAQNLLQLLNGNKLWIVLCTFFLSCTAVKPVVSHKPTQIIKAGTTPVSGKKDTVDVPVRDTAKKPDGVAKDVIKVDTIVWSDISKDKPPVREPQKTDVTGYTSDFKPVYNIKMLLPLNSDDIGDPGTSRFTFFYSGVLLALEELGIDRIKLNVDVIDTDENNFDLDKQLNSIVTPETDLVIGPFDKDKIKVLSEACKKNNTVLVSPWYTSSKLTVQNPYYVQMNPNLKEHFNKIVQFSVNRYQPKEITIVTRGNKDKAWVDYFENTAKKLSGSKKDFFNVYYVNTDSLKNGPTAFFNLFKTPNLKAIIIPNYSYSDENYIYSCLRRLAAEISTHSVSVIGMPILFESDKVEFDYFRALQMKVVMADFVDEDYGKIREFRRRFLDTYGEIPTVEAVKGYDLMIYLGKNLWKYGKHFQYLADYNPVFYLQSIYDLQRSFSDDTDENQIGGYFDYFENKHLDIIEYRGNKWMKL